MNEPPDFEPPDLEPPARRRRSRRSHRFLVLGILVLVVLSPVLVAVGWFWYQLDPPGGPGKAVRVDVRAGWGVPEIGDALEARGVIGSTLAFQAYTKIDSSGPFLAGTYELREHDGVRAAVDRLQKGPSFIYSKLALPPGMTLDQIAERVGKLKGRSAQKFLEVARSDQVRSRHEPADVHSLEGLTWPDTYFVDRKDDELTILHRIVDRFDQKVDEIGLGDKAAPLGITPYQAVVVASLIQTEARLDEDRPLIAAVVYNRVNDDIPLQIDATLLYARGTREGPITNADKQIDSPYNTYLVKGLPPTPISTVAQVSLEAALAPGDVPYRFYVIAESNGKHKFATTYEEHLQNVEEARQKGLL